MNKVTGYYIFDGMIPGRTEEHICKGGSADLPYLYAGNGKWNWLNNPESWDMNAVKVEKSECDALVKKYDSKKVAKGFSDVFKNTQG